MQNFLLQKTSVPKGLKPTVCSSFLLEHKYHILNADMKEERERKKKPWRAHPYPKWYDGRVMKCTLECTKRMGHVRNICKAHLYPISKVWRQPRRTRVKQTMINLRDGRLQRFIGNMFFWLLKGLNRVLFTSDVIVMEYWDTRALCSKSFIHRHFVFLLLMEANMLYKLDMLYIKWLTMEQAGWQEQPRNSHCVKIPSLVHYLLFIWFFKFWLVRMYE